MLVLGCPFAGACGDHGQDDSRWITLLMQTVWRAFTIFVWSAFGRSLIQVSVKTRKIAARNFQADSVTRGKDDSWSRLYRR